MDYGNIENLYDVNFIEEYMGGRPLLFFEVGRKAYLF